MAKHGESSACLAEILDAMIAAHERWLEAIDAHRSAMAQNDARRGQVCLERQRACMAQIAELEQQRSACVRSLVAGIPPLARAERSGKEITVDQLLAHMDGPVRDGLQSRRERLRRLMAEVRRRQETLRLAAGALAAHMEGLVRQVAARLQRSAVYSPAGTRFAEPISGGLDIVQ